jgi:RHS repeat-associated protein
VIERWQPEVVSKLSMVSRTNTAGDVGDKYTVLDRFGRVVEQRWTKGQSMGSPWRIDHTTYTYDRNGNRLTRTNAFSAAFSETYSYDALNQLQSFTRGTTSSPTTTQGWEFDALGNWTAVTTNGVAESRTANAQNELTQVGSAALTYSPTGNLTTDAQGRTLSYDAWNRLVSVQNAASTQVARYEYDGLNRRIVEQTGTLASPAAASAPVRDIYFSRDWQALEERVRTSTGTIPATADTRYLWSPVYVDAMIARDRNADGNTATGTGGLEQRVYAVQDANWNTTAIITATGVPGLVIGTIISRFIYSPYGDVQVLTRLWETPAAGSTPAAPWSHLFQGLKFTDVTALAYVRHRDYSASLGRFIERDPIGFDAGDNNWYRFVGNGPTGRTDPSGLCEEQTPEEYCLDLLQKIITSANALARRYYEMIVDKGELYHGKNPGWGTWTGHQDRYNTEQKKLVELVEKFLDSDCRFPPPVEVLDWVDRPAPDKPWFDSHPGAYGPPFVPGVPMPGSIPIPEGPAAPRVPTTLSPSVPAPRSLPGRAAPWWGNMPEVDVGVNGVAIGIGVGIGAGIGIDVWCRPRGLGSHHGVAHP